MKTTFTEGQSRSIDRLEALKSLRGTLAWLGPQEVKVLTAEVDPIYEATCIAKVLDDGPVFVAENVKNYPNARYVGGLLGRRQRIAKMLGVEDFAQVKHLVRKAARNPTAPRVVNAAPCQEIVIPREQVDPAALLPLIKHTELDGGRFFGAGVHYISGPQANGGSQLSFYRMSFRGRDFASIQMIPGGHGDQLAKMHYGEKIPCTVNICPPPAVELVGAGSMNGVVYPTPQDLMGIAGTLQGSPVDIVKAKTVDAYAVANAEWVIEGFILPHERVWETEEAERSGRQGEAMLHPEYVRYMGRAYRARRFEVTAITHRRDKPLYYVWQMGSSWNIFPFAEASVMELADRIEPGFVLDARCHHGLIGWGGTVIKVRKQRASQEGLQRNILACILGAARGMRLAIAVDEDVNIDDLQDVMWAVVTRSDFGADLIFGAGGRGQAFQPAERADAEGSGVVARFSGGMAIDATLRYGAHKHFVRARYPVEKIDFSKWFAPGELDQVRAQQGEFFRFLADTGYA